MFYYKIDKDGNVEPCSVEEFYNNRTMDNTQIEYTDVGYRIGISTIFLGIDHSWNIGEPLLFETMVFKGSESDNCLRWHNINEARLGHQITVEYERLKLRHMSFVQLLRMERKMKKKAKESKRQRDKRMREQEQSLLARVARTYEIENMNNPAPRWPPDPWINRPRNLRGPVEKQINSDKPLDPVQMELVRADIALLKARAEADGSMEKWRQSQFIIESGMRGAIDMARGRMSIVDEIMHEMQPRVWENPPLPLYPYRDIEFTCIDCGREVRSYKRQDEPLICLGCERRRQWRD